MQIILSPNCKALTGSIGRGFGYHIEHRKYGFFGVRDAKGIIPHDGHWKFIVACAELAQSGFMVSDIKVKREEVKKALYEAHMFIAMQNLGKDIYTANDIIKLKTTFSL